MATLLIVIATCYLCGIIFLSVRARVPAWNPVYFFAIAFGAQLLAGAFAAACLGYRFDLRFLLLFCTANCLFVFVLVLLNDRHRLQIARSGTLRSYFDSVKLDPGVYDRCFWLLAGVATISLIATAWVMARWHTLPFLAMADNWVEMARQANRHGLVTLTPYEQFRTPLFTVAMEAMTNAGVVAYFYLRLSDRNQRRRTPLIVRLAAVAVYGCAAVHSQRNVIVFALVATGLLFYLCGRLRLIQAACAMVVALVVFAILGAYRMNEGHIGNKLLGLPDVGRLGAIYEQPLVYLASGPLNFNEFWCKSDERAGGKLLASQFVPAFVGDRIGLPAPDYIETFIRGRIFVMHGQTLRTGFFEFFYDFDVIGLLLCATLMPALVFAAYRRTIGTPGSAPSAMFFVLLRPICMLPFINLFYSFGGVVAVASAFALEIVLRPSKPSTAGRTVRRTGGLLSAVSRAEIPGRHVGHRGWIG